MSEQTTSELQTQGKSINAIREQNGIALLAMHALSRVLESVPWRDDDITNA